MSLSLLFLNKLISYPGSGKRLLGNELEDHIYYWKIDRKGYKAPL